MKNENQLIASQYKIQALFCDGFKLDIIIMKGLQGYIWKSNDCSGYGYFVQECIDMALYMQSQQLNGFVEEESKK